jgi:hypothetical protein
MPCVGHSRPTGVPMHETFTSDCEGALSDVVAPVTPAGHWLWPISSRGHGHWAGAPDAAGWRLPIRVVGGSLCPKGKTTIVAILADRLPRGTGRNTRSDTWMAIRGWQIRSGADHSL